VEVITIKEKVTIYTIANELSMTPSMVSRAFNPNAKIAEGKRKLVLEAAEKYGFVPNKLASRLSMRTVKIGILIVYKAQHVRDGLLHGFRRAFELVRDYKLEYTVTEVDASVKGAHMCRDELFSLADCDGIILSGFGSSLCRELICEFAEINPNIVFVQNVCEDTPYLFASKHDEELAATVAAQLLCERLHYKARRNVFIFTGDRTSSVHKRAYFGFKSCAERLGMNIIGDFDMKDRDDILSENIDSIFERLGSEIDGIYISSGNSSVLCKKLSEFGEDISLVCSDVNEHVCSYMENGTAFATVCQNFEEQAKKAFEGLASHILGSVTPDKTIYTDFIPVFASNLHLYRNK